MKFSSFIENGKYHIKAEFEEDDSELGRREEGSGNPIELKTRILEYSYVPKEVHPDIFALMCILNFYPFVGSKIEFEKPVSKYVQDIMNIPVFKQKKNIEVINVDPNMDRYSGSKIATAFGGGIDSTSILNMFPETMIVHEAHTKDGEIIEYGGISKDFHKFVEGLPNSFLIYSNQRMASFPYGWHTWPASMTTSLLISTDHDVGIILCGAILEGNYLWSGRKFWDRGSQQIQKNHGITGNYWQSAFTAIGLPLWSPVEGSSEYGTMRLSLDNVKDGSVDYGTGLTKCFRRDILRSVVDEEFSVNWDFYNSDGVHALLEARPLYYGNIFVYAEKVIDTPDWYSERISDVQKIHSDWPVKYYPGALDLCPRGWVSKLVPTILENFELMNEQEVDELRSWNQDTMNKT